MLPEAKTGVYLFAYLRPQSNSSTKQNEERKFYSASFLFLLTLLRPRVCHSNLSSLFKTLVHSQKNLSILVFNLFTETKFRVCLRFFQTEIFSWFFCKLIIEISNINMYRVWDARIARRPSHIFRQHLIRVMRKKQIAERHFVSALAFVGNNHLYAVWWSNLGGIVGSRNKEEP